MSAIRTRHRPTVAQTLGALSVVFGALSGAALLAHLWWPALLCAVALALTLAMASWRRGMATTDEPNPGATAPRRETPPAERQPAAAEPVLWRTRTTVRDQPGSLAALCGALADQRIDVLSLQTHPLGDHTVDEFVLRAPAALGTEELRALVRRAGGRDTWLERADTHDLVDTPVRVLELATRTAADGAELPLALRRLLGRCTVRSLPDARLPREAEHGQLGTTELRLPDPAGGVLLLSRPQLPFTPTEFARARGLVELDGRLRQARSAAPTGTRRVTDSRGRPLTLRRADLRDLAAVRALHQRCSPETLRLRYHGPMVDSQSADRLLTHLLSPRFGRTLAAETPEGQLVALGHLLWDGTETEVALLVADHWQRRGVGGALLEQLVELATETGCETVYAVTQASNSGMIATMRGLGLALDYQVEEGTVVVTARLSRLPASRPVPVDGR
ncbi:GNAT family N-acetyltransferase [Streptomyces sp. NPDC005438]|uniref:GNAT family N-acetyltransferase n=1 Tax=Streptomyces sp. NPDC005438 TaxID=3156880 RepID=UPI0033A1AAF9